MATPPHQKSMWRYSSEAAAIATELAEFTLDVADEWGVDADRLEAVFTGMKRGDLFEFEEAHGDEIADFVKRPPSQWNAALRRIDMQVGSEGTRRLMLLMLLALAVIGAKRVERLVLLRDEYRNALAPGCGYRATAAALYRFAGQIDAINGEIDWPQEVFAAALRERAPR